MAADPVTGTLWWELVGSLIRRLLPRINMTVRSGAAPSSVAINPDRSKRQHAAKEENINNNKLKQKTKMKSNDGL